MEPCPRTQAFREFLRLPVEVSAELEQFGGAGASGAASPLDCLERRLQLRAGGGRAAFGTGRLMVLSGGNGGPPSIAGAGLIAGAGRTSPAVADLPLRPSRPLDVLLANTDLLAYLLSFLEPRDVLRTCPTLNSDFWLAVNSASLWRGFRLKHTHAPIDAKLVGVYRLLAQVGEKLQKLSLDVFVADAGVIELLPTRVQFRNLRVVELGCTSAAGVGDSQVHSSAI